MSNDAGLGLTRVIKYDNLVIKYDNPKNCHGGDFMTNIDEQANTKVIPLPKERECLAILGEDGEVTGYLSKTRKNVLGVHWVATFQDGLTWLAQQDMTGEQWRVLAYLLGRLDFDNYLKVQQTEISDKLHIKKPKVSRAMKKLAELDIITVGPMAGRSKTYRLNPRIAHRGAKNYRNTLIEYDTLKKLQKKNKPE